MSSKPLVSILINNYNYGRFLKDAIDSALNQTYKNIEVIVVDDGSTDNSQETIEAYGNSIVSIFKENGGQASAFNTGYMHSHGEIICFLDADDIFEEKKVEEVVASFEKRSDLGWHFHTLHSIGEDSQDHIDNCENISDSEIYDLRIHISRGRLEGCSPLHLETATSGMSFKRTLLKNLLPMSETIKITADDYLKYAALGTSIGVFSFQKLSRQRIHRNNFYTYRNDQKITQSKVQLLTAYQLRKNHEQLSKFSHNLFSLGISLNWWAGANSIKLKDNETFQIYLKDLSFFEKLKIYLKAIYYRYIRYYI